MKSFVKIEEIKKTELTKVKGGKPVDPLLGMPVLDDPIPDPTPDPIPFPDPMLGLVLPG